MNHVAKALSRIIWQYKNSPKFQDWISVIPGIAQEKLELPAQILIDIYDIDNNEGALLDIIGRTVGQERNHPLLLDDEVYRIVIRSKIFKNSSDATIDSIINAAENITGASVRRLDDGEDMTFSIVFETALSSLVSQLLVTFDLIPRPQGVKFSGFINPPEGLLFGFSELGMATPSYIAGFSEILEDGLFALELSDGSLLELSDGTLLGISLGDTVATDGGGQFVELNEVA